MRSQIKYEKRMKNEKCYRYRKIWQTKVMNVGYQHLARKSQSDRKRVLEGSPWSLVVEIIKTNFNMTIFTIDLLQHGSI